MMPEGAFGLTYNARVEVPDAIDDIDIDARELPIGSVPGPVLLYLLPSRFCVSDVMANQAWELFGTVSRRAGAGCRRSSSAVHGHLTFGYGTSSPTYTAQEAYEAGKGVCRDFAHVAITFCRALNIPARYVFGYLPDIERADRPARRWTSPPGWRCGSMASGTPSTRATTSTVRAGWSSAAGATPSTWPW